MRRTFQSLVAASTSAKLYLVALFLFLYSFAPGFGTPLYYFMTDELKFSQSYIGILGAIASAGWIAGALVHRFLLRGMSSKALLTLSIVLGTLSAASFLLLADPVTRGDRELRQRRCHDDRHHRLAHARRRLLSQARRGLRVRRAHVDHESRGTLLQHRRRLALRPRVRWHGWDR